MSSDVTDDDKTEDGPDDQDPNEKKFKTRTRHDRTGLGRGIIALLDAIYGAFKRGFKGERKWKLTEDPMPRASIIKAITQLEGHPKLSVFCDIKELTQMMVTAVRAEALLNRTHQSKSGSSGGRKRETSAYDLDVSDSSSHVTPRDNLVQSTLKLAAAPRSAVNSASVDRDRNPIAISDSDDENDHLRPLPSVAPGPLHTTSSAPDDDHEEGGVPPIDSKLVSSSVRSRQLLADAHALSLNVNRFSFVFCITCLGVVLCCVCETLSVYADSSGHYGRDRRR